MFKEFTNLIKSQSDHREYKLIKLKENEIEILLISDPKTDTSSAAVNVNVGQLNDPPDRQGLAHFLEHMLFLGTSKYPLASEFDQYLSQNSGYSNAYTSLEETNYYFNCLNEAFEEGLDRFVQFFIDPLFNEEYVEKELKAVHSEHIKNIQQDSWREDYFLRYTSIQGSFFNKFGSGNMNSLNFPSIRDDLISFYNQFYSSNLMKAVILSNKTIQQLQNTACFLFSQIPNKSQNPPQFTQQPFDDTNLSKIYKIVPCKQENRVKFVWVLKENYEKKYKKNPLCYLSYLIGHEGKNSLLSGLIEEGLAESLYCGFKHISIFSTFYIDIVLSEQGFLDINKVFTLVFAYIAMLKNKGPQQWVYEENQLIKIIKFQYKEIEEPIDYTYILASKMQTCDLQDILRYDALLESFHKEDMEATLNDFQLKNLRINITSPLLVNQCELLEPIYQIKYKVEDIEDELIKIYQNPQEKYIKKFDLPPQNTFIPKVFHLLNLEVENPEKSDIKYIAKGTNYEFWYKKDNYFKIPKISLLIKFFHESFFTLKNQILCEVYISIILEKNRELIYQGEMACIETILEFKNEINFIFESFSDNFYIFLEQFLTQIVNFDVLKDIQKSIFNIQVNKIQKKYKNFFFKSPYEQGRNYSEYIMNRFSFSPEDLLEQSMKVSLEDVAFFGNLIKENLQIQCFLGGNLNREISLQISEMIKDKFFSKKQINENQENVIIQKKKINLIFFFQINMKNCILSFPSKKRVILQKKLQKNEENSYICSIYQIEGKNTIKQKVLFELLAKFLDEPFYKHLRTQEQLGYIVWCSNYEIKNQQYFKFVIQSNVECPEYLSSRIQNFINQQRQKIKDISQNEFLVLKKSVECMLKQKEFSIYQESKKYFYEINNNTYLFDLNQQMIAFLQNIQIYELIEFFECIFYDNPKNAQIQLISQNQLCNNQHLLKFTSTFIKTECFDNAEEFKKQCKNLKNFSVDN
ncbi:insulin-degrading enzyme, putative [Ichthyophthirius multifiliis]|uniref:Insulin-degrading enzyme, putative n=1 Tax=Ichthyophthirius multifiliis TaxID=5932 RepID=G0QY06_ICHMU|nr:insulin-degrading enzyme, putative [Ichthyophthirius multifiliis]EGR29906.1 insulin-degrading enzyme, putative [Ichthyophthirius multifiliis]|eukprot:XP_004031142.1 insulin-degrading enzyme, putative [Ichthyophthirius multifiliis]